MTVNPQMEIGHFVVRREERSGERNADQGIVRNVKI